MTAVRGWLGTPYHHAARVKGAGVDCGQLVIAALSESGVFPEYDPGHYTCDWHLHRDEDRYLAEVEKWLIRRSDDTELSVDARLLDNSAYELPAGEVIIFRVGRTYSHGGIVTKWPFFIHSYMPSGMVEEVDIRNTPMSVRPARVYTFEGYEG